ncbi:hypothetical protein QZH41_002436 [Actinostola sp. cb2023]|nr:hypothetical protein QZH41_002436 [Actinostola sp. cb2023]
MFVQKAIIKQHMYNIELGPLDTETITASVAGLDGVDVNVQDIDECQIGNGECEHSCQNIPGSRLCSCRKGYRLDASNKRTCADVEACKPNPCRHGGRCVVISSKTFKCDCSNTGFKGRLCEEGELPTGCHTIKTDMFKCNVQLSSTLLWKRNRVNKQASTQGIVHLVTGNGKTAIPLSLVGAASTSFSNTDVLNNIKRINKMKKNVRLETDTTCLDAIIEVPQLMELVENDAFASSFMNMISKSTPPWLQLHKKTKSENFDLSNIHATIGSKSKFSSSLLNSSNLVIYEPSIGPTISLGEDNMSLDDTKGFCYAIDVCTSDVSISLPRASVKALTSSPFLQDMKTAGWEIEPKGIAFTGITRRSVILESQWNGRNMVHQKTQDYKFAIEGKMKSKLKNKRGVKVSLEYEGDVYVDTVNVTEVFHYGFERETTAVFKGKASLNMTTTVFNKKVTIAFPVDEVFGTSTLGDVNSKRSTVIQDFKGFKIRFHGMICVQRICFPNMAYHVKGKMDKNSGLPKWFERKTNNYILENAEKATKRVKNAESVDREATNKLLRFKKTIEEVFKTQQMYEREKQTTSNKLKLAKKEYFLLKIQLHDILLPASNDKQTCRPKQCKKECSRTKICTFENKRLEINEPKYHCEEYKTHVERIEKKKRTAPDFYWKKTFKVIYTGNCHDNPFNSKLSYAMGMVGGVIGAIGDGIGGGGMGAGGLIGYAVGRLVGAVLDALGKGLFGCDNTYKSVPGPPIKITYTKVWYEDAIVKVPVTKLTCTSSLVKKVTRSFETPKLTCKQDTCIKIMDPTCIKENNNCIKQHRLLQSNRQMSELEIEKTKNLVRLNHLANKMEIASNELERINAKRIKASEELKMARAQLKHLEYAKTRSVNGVREVEEFQSTKFGLKLSRLLEQTPDKKVVRVSDFTFDVTTSESDKKEIPLYLTVSSTDGKTKELRFLFDFGKDEISLHKMTTTAVNTLYQEVNDKRRKRRSISDELFDTIEKTNNTENLKTLDNHDRCLMAKKANLFYRDIVKSLELLIHDREDVEKSNMADIRQLTSLYQKFENISRDGPSVNKENDTDNSDEMIKSYVDLISSLMNDKQNYSLMSWNQSLISWRAFLEVLTNERSFADCASVQDCVFAVGDDLDELYFYESDFPRANEMREMLSNVTNDVLELITRNFTVEEFMYKISMLDQLLNQTVDTNVLCGKIPEITFNSEESRVVLENDTFVLECAAKSDTPVTYEWIHKNVSIHRSTNGSLTISHANTSHAGAYQCNAINRKGAVTSNVTVIAINSKPKITQQPNDTKVYINDDVGLLLTCNATGVPFPTIDWFFVSQRPNSSIINLNNDNGTFLYYQQMTDNDSGYYFCTATNKHGQVKSTKAKVWVLDISPGEPRLGVKVNMTKRCKRQEGCYRHTIDGSKELNQYSLLLSKSMNSSESQIIDIKYAAGSAGQGNSTVSFIYRSTKPQKQDVNEPVFDPILESFARKRTHLVNGLKTLYQQMKNGSLSVTNDDDEEVSGDPESLIAWIVPPGCPRGQEPHSNGYMCALCSPGTYGKVDGRCEPCPVKTYQYQAGQTKRCFSCEYGFSTKQIGSSSPDDCHDMRPSPPRHLQATAVGSTRLEVKWLKPEENSDSILYYWMKYGQLRQRQRQRLRTKHVPKTTTTWSLARLRKFTDYRIMVYAVNWYGMTKSQIIIVQTGEDTPSPPVKVTGRALGTTEIMLRFRTTNGQSRTNVVYYGDNVAKLNKVKRCRFSSCFIYDLKEDTVYHFKVFHDRKVYITQTLVCLSMTVAVASKQRVHDWELI